MPADFIALWATSLEEAQELTQEISLAGQQALLTYARAAQRLGSAYRPITLAWSTYWLRRPRRQKCRAQGDHGWSEE